MNIDSPNTNADNTNTAKDTEQQKQQNPLRCFNLKSTKQD